MIHRLLIAPDRKGQAAGGFNVPRGAFEVVKQKRYLVAGSFHRLIKEGAEWSSVRFALEKLN